MGWTFSFTDFFSFYFVCVLNNADRYRITVHQTKSIWVCIGCSKSLFSVCVKSWYILTNLQWIYIILQVSCENSWRITWILSIAFCCTRRKIEIGISSTYTFIRDHEAAFSRFSVYHNFFSTRCHIFFDVML